MLSQAEDIYFSNPDSSYQLSAAAEIIALQQNDSHSLAQAKSYLGRYHLLKSELELSSLKLNEALAIYKTLNDSKGIGYVLKLKSILLDRIGNKEESVSTLEESLQMFRKAGHTDGVTAALLNLSLDYIERKDFIKAENALKEVESNLTINKTNQYFLHQNIGLLCFARQDFDKAIEEYQIAMNIAKESKMIDSYATILKLIGKTYFSKKDYKKTEEFLNKSKEIATENNLDNELIETYDDLILLMVEQKNFEGAFQTLKIQNEIKNKILNIEKINRITSLEKKLAISEKEKEVVQAKSNTQKLLYVVIAIALLLILTAYMFLKTRSLKNKISNQHTKLEEKNHIIEEKNKDITDSIHYAKRIQEAILPSDDVIKQLLPNSFVFYQPKDIVSGDIYWLEKFGKQTIIAAVDCTGHGVPGAFMSIVAANLFNEAVNEHGITQPAAILNSIRKSLIKKLRKKNDDSSIKDGMDTALISINEEDNYLEYSGAYNPLWIIRDSMLTEYKGDKTPIGINIFDKNVPFTNHKIDIKKGDLLYIFTDGFADQFGGPQGKKFKYKKLKELLISCSSLELGQQKTILENSLNSWKGNLEQVDDILIIGIKV